MPPVLRKTLGGLSSAYYFPRLFLGSLPLILIVLMATYGYMPMPLRMKITVAIFMVLHTLLFPYAMFFCESIFGLRQRRRVFWVNVKTYYAYRDGQAFMTILALLLSYMFGIFVAPLGLVWLYFHHTKAQR